MLLRTIWIMAALIAGSALVGMFGLILARAVTAGRARRLEARRTLLLEGLFGWLEERRSDEEAKALLVRNRSLAASLLIEIFELMRGEDQQRLAALAESAQVPQYLYGAIRSRSAAERLGAAESLVWFPSPETRAALRRALEDRDDDVGLAAAASLAELGEDLPVARLLEIRLGQGGESSRRLEAVLVRIAPRQVEDLIEITRDEAAPDRVRAAAIDALTRTGSFDLIEPVAALSGAPAPTIRAAVARGLGVFGHPQASQTILELLQDPDWEVRAEAADAAGRIGIQEAGEQLSGLLEDENWWVRFRAGEALAALGGKGIETLKRLAAAKNHPAHLMAALVLAERGVG